MLSYSKHVYGCLIGPPVGCFGYYRPHVTWKRPIVKNLLNTYDPEFI